jgi:hypothetical protein
MPGNFDSWRAEIERWRQHVYTEAALGVADVMPALEAAARSTDLYGDDTGATRGSTIGYVVAGDGSVDQEHKADAALAFAEERNPGSGSDEYVDVAPDEVAGFLTAFTAYAPDLENRGGGSDGFLGPTMDGMGVQLHEGAMARIGRLLGS